MHAGCSSSYYGNANLRQMADKISNRDTGKPCGVAKRQALVPEQRRGECPPDAGLRQQRIVIEMHEQGLGFVAIEHHDRILARRAKRHGRVVLQFSNAESFHQAYIMQELLAGTNKRQGGSWAGFPGLLRLTTRTGAYAPWVRRSTATKISAVTNMVRL